MTDSQTPERPETVAKMIAWDEYAPLENSWESNHRCNGAGYGCCGGGKDIDRAALESQILSALRSAEARGRVQGLREAADEVDDAPLPQFYLVRNDHVTIKAWLRWRADTIEQEQPK